MAQPFNAFAQPRIKGAYRQNQYSLQTPQSLQANNNNNNNNNSINAHYEAHTNGHVYHVDNAPSTHEHVVHRPYYSSSSLGTCTYGWLWVLVALALIWAVVNTLRLNYHVERRFSINAFPLHGSGAVLVGTVEFKCHSSAITYSLQYGVTGGDRVTRIHLFAADPGATEFNTVLPLPLCVNGALDPVNPYGGPFCPDVDPVCAGVGTLCASQGTLATGSSDASLVIVDKELCEQFAANDMRVRMFSETFDEVAGGVAVGDLRRHAID